MGYLFTFRKNGASTVLASFVAALVVTQASYFLSKRRKTLLLFLIAGIIPLVPGLGLYRTMFAILESNYSSAIEYATLTFEIAGVIAGAIVIISLLPLLWRKPRR